MTAIATAIIAEPSDVLSAEMLRLLNYAITHKNGHLHALRVGSARDRHRDAATLGLIDLGYAKWENWYDPVITDSGRAAIGAPSEAEAAAIERAQFYEHCRILRENADARKRAERTETIAVAPKIATRDPNASVCLLLDVRGKDRANSIQVWSYIKGKIVSLPLRFTAGAKAGKPMIEVLSRDTKRWHAVRVPKWLARREGLYGHPRQNPNAFCRDGMGLDTRTREQIDDDHDQDIAQIACDFANRGGSKESTYAEYFEKQIIHGSGS
ncbi:MAG: hypothetical protein JWL86_623 [Rhizobium sp.]|nr:hypothetical protein [Rhizobium sp.]